jgi:predicted nucleic acid-binding Zn ribbon protein
MNSEEEKAIISQAMRLLGRKGGSTKTKLKAEVARLNGAKQFMPVQCTICGKHTKSWHVSVGRRATVCLKCMAKYRKTLSPAEREKDIILVETDGHIFVDDRSSEKKATETSS